jgi:hypothetical protein
MAPIDGGPDSGTPRPPASASGEPSGLDRTFSSRILTLGLNALPVWVRLYLVELGPRWAAVIQPDDDPPPAAGAIRLLALFGATREEAERAARAYLGEAGMLSCPRCGSLQAVALAPRTRAQPVAGGGAAARRVAREFICKECGEAWMSRHA